MIPKLLKRWSGRRGSNPRRPAWEAGILPLNYSRALTNLLFSRLPIAKRKRGLQSLRNPLNPQFDRKWNPNPAFRLSFFARLVQPHYTTRIRGPGISERQLALTQLHSVNVPLVSFTTTWRLQGPCWLWVLCVNSNDTRPRNSQVEQAQIWKGACFHSGKRRLHI